jgi:outer membrane lipoprotein SlyB
LTDDAADWSVNTEVVMKSIPKHAISALAASVAIGLAGCADQPLFPGSSSTSSSTSTYPQSPYYAQTGTVDRIEVVQKGASKNVAGTVIGGIVGGLIGSQIGSGSGRTAATVAGAAGGAIAGNVIEGRRRTDNESFRVSVRLDNGSYETVMQEDINDLRTGDRVRVDGGRIVRI